MSVPESLASLAGRWAGTNRLWLSPEEPVRESPGTASVALVANGLYLTIRYTWAADGRPQEGLLLLGVGSGNAVTAAWVDSWHQSDRIMPCEGRLSGDDTISALGSYAAPPGPDWGWRIAIEPEGRDAFRMTMYNIPPGEAEQRAVLATFARER